MGRYIGIFIALLLIGSCSKGQQEEAAEGMGGMMDGPPPVAVFVEPVQMVDYAPAIRLIGETRAEQRAVLAAEVAGRVTGIRHRVGERHNRSEGWLISIDSSSYQAGVDSAQAMLDQAKENLRKAQNGPRMEDIKAQEAQVESAAARLQQAEDNLRRMESLAKGGIIAETALISARTEAETARAAHAAAQQMLGSMNAGTRDEDIKAAEAAVNQAQSALRNSQISLGRTTVNVQFDAIVSGLMVEVGQYVGPGTPLVEVVSANAPEAWFNLPEEELGNVSPGDDVEMRFAGFPGEVFHGAVISVSPAADEQTRQFPLRVHLDDARIRPGMTIEGRILRDEPVPTKMISMDSVIQSPLGTVCWVMDPVPDNPPFMGSARQVIIETGARLDSNVIISSDELEPGMQVVTRGKQQVYPTATLMAKNLMPPGGMGGEGGPPPGMPDGAAPGGPGSPEEAGAESAPAEAAAGGDANPCKQESDG